MTLKAHQMCSHTSSSCVAQTELSLLLVSSIFFKSGNSIKTIILFQGASYVVLFMASLATSADPRTVQQNEYAEPQTQGHQLCLMVGSGSHRSLLVRKYTHTVLELSNFSISTGYLKLLQQQLHVFLKTLVQTQEAWLLLQQKILHCNKSKWGCFGKIYNIFLPTAFTSLNILSPHLVSFSLLLSSRNRGTFMFISPLCSCQQHYIKARKAHHK